MERLLIVGFGTILLLTGPVAVADGSIKHRKTTDRTPIGMATKERLAPNCVRFMNHEGHLGDWGKILFDKIAEEKYMQSHLRSHALETACPRFNTLSDRQKIKAWVWFYAALAHEESSCQLNVGHPTHIATGRNPNHRLNPTTGHGLWALESQVAYRDHRGEACGDINTFGGQVNCTVDIMHKTQLTRNEGAIDGGSYWGPVRRYNKQLAHHLKRFKACF